jgi:hypothetical protein
MLILHVQVGVQTNVFLIRGSRSSIRLSWKLGLIL